jgi:hypothetical protein
MTYRFCLYTALGLATIPAAATAHPGHFDFAPLAHDFAHALPYVFLAAGAVFAAQRLHRSIRAKRRRDR